MLLQDCLHPVSHNFSNSKAILRKKINRIANWQITRNQTALPKLTLISGCLILFSLVQKICTIRWWILHLQFWLRQRDNFENATLGSQFLIFISIFIFMIIPIIIFIIIFIFIDIFIYIFKYFFISIYKFIYFNIYIYFLLFEHIYIYLYISIYIYIYLYIFIYIYIYLYISIYIYIYLYISI